jgi:hypothetical protein
MSALPPKADMLSVKIDVCFVPKAVINEPCPRILFFARATTSIGKPWRYAKSRASTRRFASRTASS